MHRIDLRRTARPSALLALGVLALCALAATPARATFAGANGVIVTQSFKNRAVLSSTDPLSGVATELPIRGANPTFSPNGRTLAVACGASICLADPDGSNERKLRRPANAKGYRWPAFSPNSKRIAFVEGQGTLSQMRVDGSDVEVVEGAGRAWQPEFFPTGDRIVFSRKAGRSRDIYAINSDGKKLTRLSNAPRGFTDINPSVSPDGRLIAFERTDGFLDEIWVMRANGRKVTPLVTDSSFLAATPAFSPDGRQIAFSGVPRGEGPYHLWLMNADGSGQAALNSEPALQPTWQPVK